MTRLLSTKILSKEFKEELLMNSISLIEQPFIKIRPIKKLEFTKSYQSIIFSSQNAVKIALSNSKIKLLFDQKPTYCIGKKTALLLIKNGQKVVKIAKNSSELAHMIVKNFQNESFSFLCGKSRITDLEEILSLNNIPIQPIEIYETSHQPHIVKEQYDGLIFFSPSGVKSYAIKNGFDNIHSFCLGNTTAQEVKKFTSKFTIANAPNEKQLLISIIKHFN